MAADTFLIMLDHILGEYDFAVKVGAVDHVEVDAQADFDGVPLDDFVPLFDACWRDELGHTGVFPPGEHAWSGVSATREAEDGREVEVIVMRNDAATALVGRADLMNAIALTSYRAPLGSDVGGVCGLYAQWPTR